MAKITLPLLEEKLKQIKNRILAWYYGKPSSKPPKIFASLMIIRVSQVERHWTANATHSVVQFLQKNWIWLFSMTVDYLKTNGNR